MSEKKKKFILELIAAISAVIGFAILIVFLIIVVLKHNISSEFNYQATQTIGVFIGGVIPVFLSFTTIILIYLTYKTNRKELKKLNTFNEAQKVFNNEQLKFNNAQSKFREQDQVEKTIHNLYRILKNWLMDNESAFEDQLREIKHLFTVTFHQDAIPVKTAYKQLPDLIKKRIFNNNGYSLIKSRPLLKAINSIMLRVFNYLELSEIEEIKWFYKYEVSQDLTDQNLLQLIALYGFISQDLKLVIENNGMLRNLKNHLVTFEYIAYNEGEPAYVGYRATYDFNLKPHYKDSAFESFI